MHLTIEISDQVAAQLQQRAAATGVSVEELSRATLEKEFRPPPAAEPALREPLIERLVRAWTVHL